MKVHINCKNTFGVDSFIASKCTFDFTFGVNCVLHMWVVITFGVSFCNICGESAITCGVIISYIYGCNYI